MSEYTVISTSGWQGSGWKLRASFENRKEATAFADEIQQPNARFGDYIVAVVGKREPCPTHGDFCWIADTRRVHTSERDLKSRSAHISDYPIE